MVTVCRTLQNTSSEPAAVLQASPAIERKNEILFPNENMGIFGNSAGAWFRTPSKKATAPPPPISFEDGTSPPLPETSFRSLIGYTEDEDGSHMSTEIPHRTQKEILVNSPIFSPAAYKLVESTLFPAWPPSPLIQQYGLLGIRQEMANHDLDAEDRLLLANVNVPWSAFICGSQGSGKSHTLSCLLESSLLPGNVAGKLTFPLAGMAIHYDNFTSRNATQLCEAAYLCSSGIPVTIMVSPSNIWAMDHLYRNLPGLSHSSPRPRVVPLYFNENQLNISRILKLMAIKPGATNKPLYMGVVMKVIREMAMSGSSFDYKHFLRCLSEIDWVKGQEAPLNLRLQVLESFLTPSSATKATTKPAATENIWAFEPGTLTIVDLSDPFLSADDACCLFSICLSIFLEERAKCGRVIVMDEAHKVSTPIRILFETGDYRSSPKKQCSNKNA